MADEDEKWRLRQTRQCRCGVPSGGAPILKARFRGEILLYEAVLLGGIERLSEFQIRLLDDQRLGGGETGF